MPAPERKTNESHYLRILAVLAKLGGGELRVKASEIEAMDEKFRLIEDYLPETNEVIFRYFGKHSRSYKIEGEVGGETQAWTPTKDPIAAPGVTEMPNQNHPKTRSTTLSENENLVNLEDQLRRRRIARMVLEERQATSNVP